MTRAQQKFLAAALSEACEKADKAEPGHRNALALAYLATWSSKAEFVKTKRRALRPVRSSFERKTQ